MHLQANSRKGMFVALHQNSYKRVKLKNFLRRDDFDPPNFWGIKKENFTRYSIFHLKENTENIYICENLTHQFRGGKVFIYMKEI